MKTFRLVFGLFAFAAVTTSIQAQNVSGIDSTGLPGDNFSLQGALEMFQKANSPEEFEKMLNSENNHVNNLDLNDDGQVDYVRVIDKVQKGDHVFILQVPVSETESQDIATIELEKTGDTTAILQIVGDEDIYGEETIVEPDSGSGDEIEDNDDGKGGPYYNYMEDYNQSNRIGVAINVWFWPCVRFVYAPVYTVWSSPWQWRRYPVWWHPWRPLPWYAYHPFIRPYHSRFVVVHTNRIVTARRIYTPLRVSSVTVRTRHATVVNHYRVARTTYRRAPVRQERREVRRNVRPEGNHRGGRRHG